MIQKRNKIAFLRINFVFYSANIQYCQTK